MRWLLGVVFLALHVYDCYSTQVEQEEKFVGWSGETYIPPNTLLLNTKEGSVVFDAEKDPWVETVSWAPRAFVYHNFMSDEECQHIIAAAAPHMKRSTVVGAGGASVEDPVRTSYGTFVPRMADPMIEAVQMRVATWTHLPMVHQEDMQVLRYGIGQKYAPHMDSHQDPNFAGPVGRTATVLLYLNDCEEGGETAFPNSRWADPAEGARRGPWSPCAEGLVAMKPRKGDALLFWSLDPSVTQDPLSLHTGCPVLKGYKWTATVWIHTDPFRPESFVRPDPHAVAPNPGVCEDLNPACDSWATSGECEKNVGYMLGTVGGVGFCRKACKACEACAKSDSTCQNRNRQRGGYLVYENAEFDSLGVPLSQVDASFS